MTHEHEPLEAGTVDGREDRTGEVVNRERVELGDARVTPRPAAYGRRRQIDCEHASGEKRDRRLPAPRAVHCAVNEHNAGALHWLAPCSAGYPPRGRSLAAPCIAP